MEICCQLEICYPNFPASKQRICELTPCKSFRIFVLYDKTSICINFIYYGQIFRISIQNKSGKLHFSPEPRTHSTLCCLYIPIIQTVQLERMICSLFYSIRVPKTGTKISCTLPKCLFDALHNSHSLSN